ncbi:MAG: PAS domain S-box protein, partial [Acidimicrobiales bacterium]
MEADSLGTAALSAREAFARRLRRHALDRTVLSNPPVAVTFCVLRAFGLIAPLPYWALVLLVGCAGTTAVFAAAVLGDGRRHWDLPAFVGFNTGVITVVAYATGWGPILSIGFIFGAGSALQLFGSAATRWNLSFTFFWMVLAQLGIALGIAPTMIRQPLVNGLAGLSLLGALLTIALLGRVTAAREKVESDLRQSEGRFKALVSNAADVIIVVDEHGLLKYVSPAFERTLGLSPACYYDRSTAAFIHPEDLEHVNEQFPIIAADPTKVIRTHLRIRDSKGAWRQFEATIANRMDDPDVRGIVGNLHDITDLLEAHEWFRSAFEDAPIGIALATTDGVILRANRAYGSILGRSATDVLGASIRDFTHPDDWSRNEFQMRRISEEGSDGYELEKRYIHSDGHEVWAMVHVSCVRDSVGRPRYMIGQIQDVTEARGMRERLAHAAIHDPLTGLPNRELFMDRLNMALRRAGRNGRQVAVAFLDLDRFKLVNDGLGHATGDELLTAAANRLREALRAEDTVARFGGDEFTILWELERDQDALEVARRVLDELQRPFEFDEAPVFVTASAGVAVCTDASIPAARLLRDADSAMYLAKESGRARVELFDGEGSAQALESLRVLSELHKALADGEFELHYQPIVD